MKYYRPLPDCLTIKESEIEGLGLIAKNNIVKDTNLGISHVYHVDFDDNYIRTPLGGFINHSEKPNCERVDHQDKWYLKTTKDINKNEELTLKYTMYKPIL